MTRPMDKPPGVVRDPDASAAAWSAAHGWRALADALPALVSAVDRECVYRFVNRAYTEWFGEPVESIVGRAMRDVIGAEAFAVVRPHLDAALAGETVRFEATLPYRVGGTRRVLGTYSPERAADGRVTGVFVLVHDITAHREAERALRERGREFETYFALPHVGKVQADPRTRRFVRVNPRFCEIAGYSEQELIGMDVAALTHPDDRARDAELYGPFARGEVPEYHTEKRYLRRDGSIIWVRVYAGLIRDEDGLPSRTIAAVQEITAEKEADARLRSSEEAHRLLVQLHDETRAIADPSRVTELIVQRVGAHFGVTRCSYGEIDGSGEFVTVRGDHVDGVGSLSGQYRLAAFGDPILEVVRAGTTLVITDVDRDPRIESSEVRTAYRDIQMQAVLCVPLVKDGRFVALFALHHDRPRQWSRDDVALVEQIAERTWYAVENARTQASLRESRDALRRLNAELSDADRRKDQFIAVLAHELRNPLAPVRYAVEVLRLRGPDQPELDRARATIERQVQQMARLLDDLLDVARVGQGKLQMQRAPLPLHAAISMAVETSMPAITGHQHELRVCLPDPDVVVDGDSARLTQVFANLLNNAARYTPVRGQIALESEVVDDEPGGVRARITVRDNGVGLQPDQIGPIFSAFSQVESSRGGGGLGLGLSLARAILTLHDGTIEAHSAGPGAGSAFVVTLPCHSASTEQAVLRPTTARSVRGRRVLVVDDNRDAADSLVALLALEGHEAMAAYDGHSAIRCAIEMRPDAVLLDIGLPDIGGDQVARQLRGRFGSRLRIVAISGWGQERDRLRALEAGCDAHLTKPADLDALRAFLKTAP